MWDSLDSLSLESDTANHNTWNDKPNLATHYDFGTEFKQIWKTKTWVVWDSVATARWTGYVRSCTRSGIRGTLQPLKNDAQNPWEVCWVCRPGRQWGVVQERMGTVLLRDPKNLVRFSLKTGDMILLHLLGFHVRYHGRGKLSSVLLLSHVRLK